MGLKLKITGDKTSFTPNYHHENYISTRRG